MLVSVSLKKPGERLKGGGGGGREGEVGGGRSYIFISLNEDRRKLVASDALKEWI